MDPAVELLRGSLAVHIGRVFVLPLLAAAMLVAGAGAPAGENAARPLGEPVPEPPTLRSLGFYWIVGGDADGDARVEIAYRAGRSGAWRKGMPLFRVEAGAHRAEGRSLIPVPDGAHLFAGSLLMLRPDTEYEVRLRLVDPDGGGTERLLRERTLAEPRFDRPLRRLHVAPGSGGGTGSTCVPFRGLAAAQAAARPGDLFLLRAGVYPGTFRVSRSGEPGRPIVWRGTAGAVLDGKGEAGERPARAVDAVGARDVWLEGLTIRNAEHGIVAHNAARLVVRRCRIEGVEFGITFTRNDEDTTRGFFITDNEIEGPSTWPRTQGIEDARGIQATGAGHVIAYNRVRGFADGIDTFMDVAGAVTPRTTGTVAARSGATSATPGKSSRCAAIDIHNNDIHEMTDDGIEMDYSERNTRCFENRLTNVFQGISAQPVYGGPVYIFRNALYNIELETFKLHNSPSGVLMLHNTSVKAGTPLVLWTSAEVRHSISRNNLFVGTEAPYAYDCTAPMTGCDFDYDGFAGGPFAHFLRWNGVRYRTLADVRARAPVYRHAVQLPAEDLFASGLMPPRDHRRKADRARVDLRLRPESGAVDAGEPLPGLPDAAGRAPDLGAHELGAPLPQYGPRRSQFTARMSPGTTDGLRTRKREMAKTRKEDSTNVSRFRSFAFSRSQSRVLRPRTPGIVSFVKVVSDRVEDVSSMEAWRRAFLKPEMSEPEKALAVWETVVRFRHQDPPPREYSGVEACVHDAIKTFNVYGYGMCCCASANVAALGRAAGLPARGRILNGHSVPELFWDGAWRMLDASLINYFPKPDGTIAGVDELIAGVSGWLATRPELKGNDTALRAMMRGGGWRRGPEILRGCPFYDENGWLPAATHGWYSTMQEYDGSANGLYEYGYSEGYQVNVQLRPGERLTRSWSNRGLHVNADEEGAPGCLMGAVGRGDLRYAPRHGDLAPGRVGNGTLEWEVPLAAEKLRAIALTAQNVAGDGGAEAPLLRPRDPARPGVLILRVPSSYVFLRGEALLRSQLPAGSSIEVSLSDNHGRDWRSLATLAASGEQRIDLTPQIRRRYDYRLRIVLRGRGAALTRLRLRHDIQHSQRALPALGQGRNRITVSAGPPEGTITLEGALGSEGRGRQLTYRDFHARVTGLRDPWLAVEGAQGAITVPLATPGEITRLRLGAHFRARAPEDRWEVEASFDKGRTFRTVGRLSGPTPGRSQSLAFDAVPPGTRAALVRLSGRQQDTTCLFRLRIDADFREPHGGFAPLRVTYVWKEEGVEKRHVHVATRPEETYTIDCGSRPLLKRLVVERADESASTARARARPHRSPGRAHTRRPATVGRSAPR